MEGQTVTYNNDSYIVYFDYNNGFLEIKKVDSFSEVLLVKAEDVQLSNQDKYN